MKNFLTHRLLGLALFVGLSLWYLLGLVAVLVAPGKATRYFLRRAQTFIDDLYK